MRRFTSIVEEARREIELNRSAKTDRAFVTTVLRLNSGDGIQPDHVEVLCELVYPNKGAWGSRPDLIPTTTPPSGAVLLKLQDPKRVAATTRAILADLSVTPLPRCYFLTASHPTNHPWADQIRPGGNRTPLIVVC